MPKEPFVAVVKRRSLGLALIAVIAGLIALSIAVYNKAFTPTVEVTLRADHTGNELLVDSDVKERGIVVGSVKAVRSRGSGAIVTLALEPGRVNDIPSNVSAQILPKTLFGEQYVSLGYPARPDTHIRTGDTIPQDRSKGALETEKVIGDLLPILTAVDPADLNATLTAVADALHDRGDKLGQTLVNLDRYLKALNPHTKQLADDLGKLGRVALEYNGVAPDILATLSNLETSARTVVQRRTALDHLLGAGAQASDVLGGFLADNEQRLIDITGQTDKIYGLLDEYSPEFTCLFAGVNHLYNLAHQAIYNHRIHLNVTLTTKAKAYQQGQEPRLVTGYGPSCFGLPNNVHPVDSKGRFQIPDKFKCLNDGAPLTDDPSCKSNRSTSSADTRAIGSPEEDAIVNALIAGKLSTTPDKVPGVDTLLAAPLLRGQQVVVK